MDERPIGALVERLYQLSRAARSGASDAGMAGDRDICEQLAAASEAYEHAAKMAERVALGQSPEPPAGYAALGVPDAS